MAETLDQTIASHPDVPATETAGPAADMTTPPANPDVAPPQTDSFPTGGPPPDASMLGGSPQPYDPGVAGVAGKAQDVGGASNAPPAGKQPNLWQGILQGALWGLAGSAGQKHFGGGLGAGAAGYMQGKEQQAELHFKTVQAAHMTIEDSKTAKEVANYDADHQEKIFDESMTRAKELQLMTGATPIVTNSAQERAAVLQSQKDGVPPHASFQVGKDQFISFDLSKGAADGSNLKVIQKQEEAKYGKITTTAQEYAKMSPEQQIKAAHDSMEMWQPTGDETKLNTMKSDRATVANLPNDAPNKQQNLDRLDKNIATSEPLVQAVKDRVLAAYTKEHPETAAPSATQRADAIASIGTYGNNPEYKALVQEAKDASSVTDLQKVQGRADDLKKTNVMADAQRTFAKGQTDLKRQDMITEKLTPIWTKDGFSDVLHQATQIKQAASAAKDGDGLMTAMLPTMEVLGVNMAGKIRRISPTEYDAAKTNPSIVAHWNQMVDAKAHGATTEQIAGQANALADMLINGAHDKSVRDTQIMAQGFGVTDHSQISAMDHSGNVTTLDKVEMPKAANGKVMVGGKLHWANSETKQTFGPVI